MRAGRENLATHLPDHAVERWRLSVGRKTNGWLCVGRSASPASPPEISFSTLNLQVHAPVSEFCWGRVVAPLQAGYDIEGAAIVEGVWGR